MSSARSFSTKILPSVISLSATSSASRAATSGSAPSSSRYAEASVTMAVTTTFICWRRFEMSLSSAFKRGQSFFSLHSATIATHVFFVDCGSFESRHFFSRLSSTSSTAGSSRPAPASTAARTSASFASQCALWSIFSFDASDMASTHTTHWGGARAPRPMGVCARVCARV